MKEAFKDWEPRDKDAIRIQQCQDIVEDYASQGLRLTLRQLYYQLVQANVIENKERSYKNLGTLLSKARLAGLIDWDAIEDRGRRPHTPLQFNNLGERVQLARPHRRVLRDRPEEARSGKRRDAC